MYERNCEECGAKLITLQHDKRFCNGACQKASWHRTSRLRKLKYENPDISTGTKGAVGELMVCVDLLQKGFNVFRCVSPHSPIDLVAYSSQTRTCYRIEVRAGQETKDGKPIYGTLRDGADTAAVVFTDGITYVPDIVALHKQIAS